MSWVANVITVLDVPLLKNNDDPLAERIKNFKKLSDVDVDLDRGFDEIINSPIYKDFVISDDGNTSGILVYIKPDKKLNELEIQNNELKQIISEYLGSKNKWEKILPDKYKMKSSSDLHWALNNIGSTTAREAAIQIVNGFENKSTRIIIGTDCQIVDYAMRYGKPSIKDKIYSLQKKGCENLIVLPLYPQYAAATTATVCDEVYRCLTQMRWQPSLQIIPHYESELSLIHISEPTRPY